MNRNEHFIFWMSKVLYVVFYIAVPVILLDGSPGQLALQLCM